MTKSPLILAGTLLCLIGLLAIPVAARPPSAQGTASDRATIDPGLQEELWNIHTEHRLQRYDSNVQAAEQVITALESHGYDTAELSDIQASIGSKRDTLVQALENRDRTALRETNREIASLWKEFRQELRQLLRKA